ncbi:UNKNOWN [Stylonychia lemnae]|uniref:Uncharacterized protein n=1 Tax=Stylonychia lemnae TaxID=5949 RepID=A0A078ACW8_STYLE|nr:UNKNOWN [Stylonychia lemnae]|eukprot:CDW79382.1 UNKNOWN [Stylonychia lemnae]
MQLSEPSSSDSQIITSSRENDDQASSIATYVSVRVGYYIEEIPEDKPVEYNRDNALKHLLIALLYQENRLFQQCIHNKMLYQEHRSSVDDFAGQDTSLSFYS